MKIRSIMATAGILLLAVVLPLMVACEINTPNYKNEITIRFYPHIIEEPSASPPYYEIVIDLNEFKDKDGNIIDVLVPRPEDPIKAGHVFDGWYTRNSDNEVLFDFDKPIERQYNAEHGEWYYRGFSLYARWSIDITFDTKPLLDAVKGRHYNDTVGDVLYINEALLGKIESVKFDVDEKTDGGLFAPIWDIGGGGMFMNAFGMAPDGHFGTTLFPLFQSVPIGVYNFEVEVEIRWARDSLLDGSISNGYTILKQTFSIRVVDPE